MTKEPKHLEVDHGRRPAYSRAELIALRLPERWYRAILPAEQAAADRSRAEGRHGHQDRRRRS